MTLYAKASNISLKTVSGFMLVCMVLSTVAAGLWQPISNFEPYWLSGLFALLSAILLLPNTTFSQRVQLAVINLIGVALMLFALSKNVVIDWAFVFSQNTRLLSMVVSVGMLKLIIGHGAAAAKKLPVGRKAYWHTLLSLSIFGSVINISAPILIADRLTLNRPLDYFSANTLSCLFCSCASWSPFFAGTAVVLTAVQGVELPVIVSNGFPFLVMAVLVLYWRAVLFKKDELEKFHGYPLQFDSLWIPLMLAFIVLMGSLLVPQLSILIVICLAAISMSIGILMLTQGAAKTSQTVQRFAFEELPKSVNELLLFLSAGVLASGLTAMVETGLFGAFITEFNGQTAALLLASMIVVAAFGVHPVIQIAALTPLLLPVNPRPELLGLTYMFAWALGTCASPLSGTQLVMQGRFGIVAWRAAVNNWPFVMVMYGVAVVLLQMNVFFFS